MANRGMVETCFTRYNIGFLKQYRPTIKITVCRGSTILRRRVRSKRRSRGMSQTLHAAKLTRSMGEIIPGIIHAFFISIDFALLWV